MQTTSTGLALIKQFEGLSLKAYLDPVGVPTIGYGHTGGVKMGDTITADQAEQFLRLDLAAAEDAVAQLVKVPINPNQFSALVSFVYNLGARSFEDSTLLRKLNAGDYARAADEFSRWVHAGNQVLPGLVARRQAEADLFRSGVADPVAAVVDWRVFAPPERWQEHLDGVGEEARKALSWVATELGLAYTEDASTRKIFVGLAKASPPATVVPQFQHTPSSCGQTSVAMAVNALTGKKLTDGDVAERWGYQLLQALNGECPDHTWTDGGNLTPASWVTIEAKTARGLPVLIGLNGPLFSHSGRGHIVLITKVEGDKVTFADPAQGEFRQVSKSDMEAAPPHPDGKFLFWAEKR